MDNANQNATDLITLADIAGLTAQPDYVLQYAIRQYGPTHAHRVGNVRLWRRDSLPAIRESLAKTARRSTVRSRRPAAEVVIA